MRLFIAIDLPDTIRQKLSEIPQYLDKANLVAKENIHITLKFLGEVDSEEKIIEALSKISFKPFTLHLSRLGIFQRQIIVLWVGVDPIEPVLDIKNAIDKALPDFKVEPHFRPHITLARIRFMSEKTKKELQMLVRNTQIEGEFEVKNFTLYKSTLTNQGPVYEKLYSNN